jgi:hypothetical protein
MAPPKTYTNSSISTTGSISAVKKASGSRSERRRQRAIITRVSLRA